MLLFSVVLKGADAKEAVRKGGVCCVPRLVWSQCIMVTYDQ